MTLENNSVLLSICIPAYNRPIQLSELLNSIDCGNKYIEIVICEDASPRRNEIRNIVEEYRKQSIFFIKYIENETNLGFDGNIRKLAGCANGRYVLFIGDDDLFIPGALDKYLAFLTDHTEFKYILRNHTLLHEDGSIEYFKHFSKTTVIPAGEDSVAWLFKRSVSIGGFTISRQEAIKSATDAIDGTLLYQIYLMAQVCLKNQSIYCDIPIVQSANAKRKGSPGFGSSDAERTKYTPGTITEDNSINFTKSYFELTRYLDNIHKTDLTSKVRISLSKYSYPFLSIQRSQGVKKFLRYANRLKIECHFDCTPYFFIYKWGLTLLGERLCNSLIVILKRNLSKTPNL